MNNQYKSRNCEKLLIMLIIINPIDKGFINKEQKEEKKRGREKRRETRKKREENNDNSRTRQNDIKKRGGWGEKETKKNDRIRERVWKKNKKNDDKDI